MREQTTAGRVTATLALLSMLLTLAGVLPSAAAARFGISSYSMSLSSQQAGAHANQTLSFVTSTDALGNPTGELEDMTVTLPQGMLSNAQAIPRCSLATFESDDCPTDTQIGEFEVSVADCEGVQQSLTAEALAGETTISVADPAEFCSGEQGEVTIGSGPEAETARIEEVEPSDGRLTLGAPLEHDHAAGETVTHDHGEWVPLELPLYNLQALPGHQASFGSALGTLVSTVVNVDLPSGGNGGVKATLKYAPTLLEFQGAKLTLWGVPAASSGAGEAVPFASNPTSCSSPLESTLEVTSYEGESANAGATLPALSGCEDLEVSPALSVAPETTERDTPAGYEVDLDVPQNSRPEGLQTPALEDISIKLPAGTTLSPAMADGLQACSEAQFTAEACPDAAKIGGATLSTPLLGEALQGAIYIGEPSAAEKYPLRMILDGDGTSVRLAGHAEPNPIDGQVTTIFSNTPQMPFSNLKLNFFGGPTAVLANPAACGPATSSAEIISYGGQVSTPVSTFTVDNDGNGAACEPAPVFTPSFSAGTTTPVAGESSPFTLTVSRADGEPSLASFAAVLPPGLLGKLGPVPRCLEPQAALGDCPQATQVGTATVLAGPGQQPLRVSGVVYLTGPYEGAPLGLDTVIDADIGPFDLGTAIVRSPIFINPTNLQLTIRSGQLPQIMEGIPLRLRAMNITLSRPGFIVNPTTCSAASISATVAAVGGAEALVSSPFRVDGCEKLSFAPRLTASTKAGGGPTGNGASLDLEITAPPGVSGTMRTASIQLPKQLRPRLSTLTHACLARSEAQSLSACPAASWVGHAMVTSPALGAPLTGPVILVAHGGAALPSLALLLSAEGVSVKLTASLSVSSHGLVTTRFTSLPDVPISALELALPSGPRSMLGAIANVCRSTLEMPYRLADQSGTLATGSARVGVSGCRAWAARHTTNRTARKSTNKGDTGE